MDIFTFCCTYHIITNKSASPRILRVLFKSSIPFYLSQVMRVIIFDQMGNVLSKFGCSKHLEFPNGVVVNDRQEIFISDNRAHCVKVNECNLRPTFLGD